jgi:hypothetical protein
MLPMGFSVNAFFGAKQYFSSAFMLFVFNYLLGSSEACPVDKTFAWRPDFAIL